jgi:O-glycosyl hydrolase
MGTKETILLFVVCLYFGFASVCKGQAPIICNIDLNHQYQTISNFGASDCWTIQYIGNWPDKKRNAIADLLFSQEMDSNGKPKGIGLSLWRFNIGAGSREQGLNSHINTDWRRTECFLDADGNYNWNKQAGQQWFLKAAKQRGVPNILAFSNTPPVYFTVNGLGNNKGRDKSLNLKPGCYQNYADFLVSVIKGIQLNLGVKINYISPFNEPEWDWDGESQEGTPAFNNEISAFVRLLDHSFSEKGQDTKICVSESGKLDYVYKKNTDKPGRDNQIEAFFDQHSPDYIGNLSHIEKSVAAHSYWTDTPLSVLYQSRKELRENLDKNKLGYWQTEFCIMGSNEIGGGSKRDLSMKTALYVTRVIHHDLVVGNASAWQWWLGVTYSDYKDGLIYTQVSEDKTDGTYTDSKLLWCLGNYSRFVRPGSIRVGVTSDQNVNNPEGLMISSFISPATKQLVTVIINYQPGACRIQLKIKGGKPVRMIPYLTSDKEGDNLSPQAPVSIDEPVQIPSLSVMTLVGGI